MIIKLPANKVHREQTNANLENDTEEKKRKKERQLILRVKSITKVMLKD